jgi:NAD(P)H dehydrogenase (quinone)
MALAVAEGAKQIKTVEVVVKSVDQASNDDLLGADGIIVGSPTYYGLMSGEIKSFFDRSVKIHGKLEGKVGAAFTSAGGTATGAETTLLSILKAMLVHGMIVQGRHDDKHFGAAGVGKPKEQEIELCETLGKRTAELVSRLRQ